MIALDIGSKNIKICLLEKTGDNISKIDTYIEEVPESGDDKIITQAIKSIINKNKIKEKNTIVSLGDTEIIVRSLDLPLMPEEEVKNTIKLQAERLIYADLNEMDIDFNVISRNKKRMEVLFVAVPASLVSRRMQQVQDAGLAPVIMDINNLALANCFLSFSDKTDAETIILVDIGHQKTGFTILETGKICFTKNIDFGGNNISNVIANEMKISLQSAEELKKTPEKWSSVGLNIKNILRRSMADLLEAIYKSVEYCKNQQMINNVDRMLLTGGTAYLEGINEFFVEILGVETMNWNPLLNIESHENKQIGCFMSVAMGLGLRKYSDV